MKILELTQLFCGEAVWQKFVALTSKHWENFSNKEALLNQVNGDVDLATVIAFKVGENFMKWLD